MDYQILKFVGFKQLNNWSSQLKLSLINTYCTTYKLVNVCDVLDISKSSELLDDNLDYRLLGISSYGQGAFFREEKKGAFIQAKNLYRVKSGDFVYSRLGASSGSFAIISQEFDNFYVSNEFPIFTVKDKNIIDLTYLFLLTTSQKFYSSLQSESTGSALKRFHEDKFLDLKIPLPDIDTQKSMVLAYQQKTKQAEELEQQANQIDIDIEQYLFESLGIQIDQTVNETKNILQFVKFKDLEKWSVINPNIITAETVFLSQKYRNTSISDYFFVNPTTKIPKDKEISFIPMANVSDEYGEIISQENKKLQNNYTRFQEKDLLWAKITPCMQNGKSAIAQNLTNGFGFGSTEFHILRVHKDGFNIRLLHLLLRSQRLLKTAMTYFTGSAGQQRVPKSFLESLTLPVITDKEQTEIIDCISSLQQQQKQAKTKAQALRLEAITEFERAIFI